MFEIVFSVPVQPSLEENLTGHKLSIVGPGFPRKGQLFLGRDTRDGRRNVLRATEDYPVPTVPALELLAFEGDDGLPLVLDARGWEAVSAGYSPSTAEARSIIEAKLAHGTPVAVRGSDGHTTPITLDTLPWRRSGALGTKA